MPKDIDNQIAIKSVAKVQDFCSPLRALGIIGFSHTMTFGGGELAMLTDSSDFFQYYYKHRAHDFCQS